MSLSESNVLFYRHLNAANRNEIKMHLEDLDSDDRRARFLHSTSNETILSYVERIDFTRDTVFGAYINPNNIVLKPVLIGMAHIIYIKPPKIAEIALSVDIKYRRTGCGFALIQEAIRNTKDKEYSLIKMTCLANNTSMINLAKKIGFSIYFDESGTIEGLLQIK